MARVKIACTCSRCGNTFEHIHMCRNSSEAESYKAWAAENVTVCPSCHASDARTHKAEELDRYIATFGPKHALPEITGVSAKQIAYAASLRDAFIRDELCRCAVNIPRFFTMASALRLENLDDSGLSKVRELAEKEGKSIEDWFSAYRLEKLRRAAHLPDVAAVKKIEKVFSCGSAADIINALR